MEKTITITDEHGNKEVYSEIEYNLIGSTKEWFQFKGKFYEKFTPKPQPSKQTIQLEDGEVDYWNRVYWVHKSNFEILDALIDSNTLIAEDEHNSPTFKHRSSAEKWKEENEKRYSKREIREASELLVIKQTKEDIGGIQQTTYSIFKDEFNKKLGL